MYGFTLGGFSSSFLRQFARPLKFLCFEHLKTAAQVFPRLIMPSSAHLKGVGKKNVKSAGEIFQKLPALTINKALFAWWLILQQIFAFPGGIILWTGCSSLNLSSMDLGGTWERKLTLLKALNHSRDSFLMFRCPWNFCKGCKIHIRFHRLTEFKGAPKFSLMNPNFLLRNNCIDFLGQMLCLFLLSHEIKNFSFS